MNSPEALFSFGGMSVVVRRTDRIESRSRPSGRGMLFAIEGMDGSGKTTVASKVGKELVRKGRQVRLTREPSEFETGDVVRSRLTRPLSDSLVEAEIDADYFLADRVYHNFVFIKPLLEHGVSIVSDRYELGTVAYQSTQGLPIDYLLDRRRWLIRMGLVEKAAVHFVLDLQPATALKRLASRGKSEKFDDVAFLRRLRKTYESLPSLVDDRIVFINAERPVARVVDDLYSRIQADLDRIARG